MFRRKMTFTILLLVAVLVVSGGCFVRSLQPFYTKDDLITEPWVIGTWIEQTGNIGGETSGPSTFVFKWKGGTDYTVTFTNDEKEQSSYEVHLVKLDGKLYFDFYPDEPEHVDDFFISHVIPSHSFFLVNLEGNVMSLRDLRQKWFEEEIKNKALNIDYIDNDGLIILTAESKKLRDFIIKHSDEIFASENDKLILKKQ